VCACTCPCITCMHACNMHTASTDIMSRQRTDLCASTCTCITCMHACNMHTASTDIMSRQGTGLCVHARAHASHACMHACRYTRAKTLYLHEKHTHTHTYTPRPTAFVCPAPSGLCHPRPCAPQPYHAALPVCVCVCVYACVYVHASTIQNTSTIYLYNLQSREKTLPSTLPSLLQDTCRESCTEIPLPASNEVCVCVCLSSHWRMERNMQRR